ncbi:pilus assembly protein TadB [Actinomadura darangshiensis]|uniref:Pilus assembly protein TadB n=1 Tax=Actinomadura darangshiensis TaxID=705336 RepID=A0A4R5A7Z0_9ACTN|nr:type II secretion system F family protein [Actinomadura darangshiensis]TDD67230.1 pilus assembly protein TadB [Actinomadura darangshiensis]
MTGHTSLAAFLGAATGLGIILTVLGTQNRWHTAGRARPYLRRWRPTQPWRAVAALASAVVVAGVTRWPVGALLAAAACWWLPPLLGRDVETARDLARIEAVASWTESLRDTLAAAAGLEQAIAATAPVAPAPIAEDLTDLAARIESGQRLGNALRAFADRLTDPTADLVVASLILAAEQQSRDLGQLLGRLATAAREQAAMRMRVAAGRARLRSSVRIIVVCTSGVTLGLLVWSRPYLAPYDGPVGQMVLAMVGATFAAGFVWLRRISRTEQPARVLAPGMAQPSTDSAS